MKKIKLLKLSIIFMTILLTFIMLNSSFNIVESLAADPNLDLVSGTGLPTKNVIKAYAFEAVDYPKITTFPINSTVFNSDRHFFCAQHGVAYGGQYIDNTLGDGTYHNGNSVTANALGGGSSSSMTADIPSTKPDFYVDENGDLHEEKNTDYHSYKESTENPSEYVYTNWVYIPEDMKFTCEGEGGEDKTAEGGLAYLFACYLSETTNNNYKRGRYQSDPLQHAVWASFINEGNPETNPLQTQADAYTTYHEASENPNVNAKPADNVGTTLSGSTYVVGPFSMYDYVEAEDYNSPRVEVKEESIEDAIEDTEKEENVNPDDIQAETFASGTLVSIDQTLQEAFGSASDVQGTIIKAEAVVSNGSSTKRVEFTVPEGGTNFYINLNGSDIDGYDELVDIVFTYQRVHAVANGTRYKGVQHRLKFSEESNEDSKCTYSCPYGMEDYCGTCDHSFTNNLVTSDPWSGKCTHYCYTGCTTGKKSGCTSEIVGWKGCAEGNCIPGSHDDDCPEGCTADHDTCSGSCTAIWGCDGNHHFQGTLVSYTHDTTYLCEHDHADCKYFKWKYDGDAGDVAQDGFAGAGKLVNEIIEYTIKVEVPLKTDMTIYKYITKVEHTQTGGTNDLTVADRSTWSKSSKYGNTVKIERGDKVTYKIKIVNNSRFPTVVKVKDTLPANYSNLVIPSTFGYSGMSGASKTPTAITVNANSTLEYEVSLVALADTGTHENKIEFVTKNDTSEKMKYSSWGSNATHGPHSLGNIVNINYSRLEDSDYYTIKEYDITADKYITNIQHKTNAVSTYNGTGRKQTVENTKKNDPLYAEFGDVVTYQIDIYNTSEAYLTGTVTDREASPYWAPDIAYVDITDTLPKKYSNLVVKIDGVEQTVSAGTTFTLTNIKIPAGGKTTVTVTLVVEEVTKGTVEENNFKIDKTRNVNQMDIINHSKRTTTSDWYKINDYSVSIDKYISDYEDIVAQENNAADFTNESTDLSPDRYAMTEEQKKVAPLQAEKSEVIEYTIKITNEAVANGRKYATQVRPTTVKDAMDDGLTLQSVDAIIKKSDGSQKYTYDLPFTVTDIGDNDYEFTIPEKVGSDFIILEPGEYLEYTVKVTISKSNMFLYSLKNEASFTTLTNINSESESRKVTTENIADQQISSEYVKLKDLVIAGKVWLDTDRDGYINKDDAGNLESDINTIKVTDNPSIDIDLTKEYGMQDIIVKLYTKDGTLVRTTKTDAQGKYTFGKDVNLAYYEPSVYKAGADGVVESAQRIPKADNKDENMNYTEDSELIEYYIEYEYDGLVYKSTEVYSYKDNLTDEGIIESDKYLVDSNAAEFEATRAEFNTHYEIMSYNKAGNTSYSEVHDLAFEKKNHESFIKVDPSRVMTSRSFIIKNTDPTKETTDYLWLYKTDTDTQYPETEYLKYINLGLELRDRFDLKLTKDLMSIDVSVNAHDMNYQYGLVNQDKDLYYRATTERTSNTEDLPEGKYELYLYKSDYYYRYEMYKNEKVKEYKGKDSELEVLLNYKVTIYNESPNDIYAKVYEVIDFNTETMQLETATLNGTTLTISDKSKYNHVYDVASDVTAKNSYLFDGYEINYLTGMEGTVIPKDGKIEILLTYRVEKEYADDVYPNNPEARSLYLDDKYNVAQIGAYGAYGDAAGTIIEAMVDNDSNAANINKQAVADNSNIDITDTALYEDNTFRIITDLELKTDERYVSGFVYEDARSEEVTSDGRDGTVELLNHFTGNGLYEDDTSRNSAIDTILRSSGMTRDTNQDLEKDTKLDGMTVELVEIITIDGEIYEETIDPLSSYAVATTYAGTIDTADEVKEVLSAVPGNVVVRTQTVDGKYVIDSFIPGTYLVRFKYGDIFTDNTMSTNSLLHNGQDYKSTTYTLAYEYDGNTYELDDTTSTSIDYSRYVDDYDDYKDAAGNSITYKYDDYNDIKYATLSQENKSDARDNEFRRIEVMAHSETMTYDVAEFLKYTNYDGDSDNGELIKTGKSADELLEEFSYATMCFADTVTVTLGVENKIDTINQKGEAVANTNFNDLTLSLDNVDYGVVFRPENFIEITKQIKNITLTSSTGETLIDIEYEYDNNGKIVSATGAEYVQSVNTINNVQGFRYINVDESILQGAALKVEYYMIVNNIGEVDTVNKFLITEGGSESILERLNAERDLIQSTATYTCKDGDPEVVKETVDNYTRAAKLFNEVFSITYDYGQFVGDIYYKGTDADMTDIAIVPVTVSKILDFVDNDATFVQTNNSETDKFWVVTTETELLDQGLIGTKGLFNPAEEGAPSYYKDKENRKYVTYTVNETTGARELVKSNLAVSATSAEDNTTLVKAIIPRYANNDVVAANQDEAYIVIQVDAILGGDNSTEDMVYDNVAEIIEFITPVGRRTNFASTIGNIVINGTTTPFESSLKEVDTDGTEVIRLTPPTGRMQFNLFMVESKYIISIIISIVVIIVLVYLAKYSLHGKVGKSKFYK